MGSNTSPIIQNLVVPATTAVPLEDQKILILGQGGNGKNYKELIEDVQDIDIDENINDLSTLAYTYSRLRQYTNARVDIIPFEEPQNGTKGVGGLKVSGTALSNSTFEIVIGDGEFKVPVDILKNDDAPAIATKILNATKDRGFLLLPSINKGDAGLVDFTYRFNGEFGNNLYVAVEGRVAGISFTSIPTNGGSGTYDTDNSLDNLTERYTSVLFDKCISYAYVAGFLEDRAIQTNTILTGSGFCMMNGAMSDINDFVLEKNEKTMTIFANPDEQRINAIPSLFCAEFVGKRVKRLTTGADLRGITIDPRESIGGVEKNSLPYHKTPMNYTKAKKQLSLGLLQRYQNEGVSFIVNSDGGQGVELSEVLTLYKRKAGGSGDGTFSRLNYVDCSNVVDEYLFRNLKFLYGQARASEFPSVFVPNNTGFVATVQDVETSMRILYSDLARMRILKSDIQAVKAFNKSLKVTLDSGSGTFTVEAEYRLMGQTLVFRNTIKMRD